jgi:tetratricopeptide (TPR) repeat protein
LSRRCAGRRTTALRTDLQSFQVRRFAIEPFGPAWRANVTDEIASGGTEHARAVWIRAYADAFVAAKFDTCTWLSTAADLLADRDLARRMFTSARAAHESNLAAALPALETLTEGPLADGIAPDLRLKAWCMRARAISRGVGDPPRARDMARRLTAELPAQDLPDETRPTLMAALRTVLGECLLASEDADGAVKECRAAIRLAPKEPAGYVLRALIAEAAGNFSRADEWYEDAAEAGGARAVAGELFAPVPPNLLWKYGRLIRGSDPILASRVIRRALLLGVRGAGEYPERKTYVDLARALERRPDRAVAAAEAFWEAGRRYAWIGDETSAMAYLDKACRLNRGSARYRYERAEVLRIRAVREDGTVDLRRLTEAATAWREAYAMGAPDRTAAWAYLTMALITHEESGDLYRPHASWHAAAILERGLLADPGNVRLTAQLSQSHRLLGNRWTALQLSTDVLGRADDDELVFDQHLLALTEVERYAEALELLDRHGLKPGQPWLVNRKGQLLVALGEPQAALDLLTSATPSDPALHDLQVALCEHLLGDEVAARKAAQRVCDREPAMATGQRENLAANACYLTGHLDEAIATYQRLVSGYPKDAAIHCDLGLALLARGRAGTQDLAQGTQQLLEGVTASRSVYALTHLERVQLPWLLDLVRGSEHEAAVRTAVDEVVSAVGRHRADLTRPAGTVDELSATLTEAPQHPARESGLAALARLEMADDRPAEALDRYLELVNAGSGEARYGVARAVRRLQASADELARTAGYQPALERYERILDSLARIPGPDVELLAAGHLRAALAALEADRPALFARHVAHAFPPDLPEDVVATLRRAVAALICRPEQYWRVIDAARAMRAEPGVDEDTVAAGNRLVSVLDLSALLCAGRGDVDEPDLFPLAVPVAVHLDPDLMGKDDWSGRTLGRLLSRMRSQVEEDTGVYIPVIDTKPLPDGCRPGSYRIELYEVELRQGRTGPGRYFVGGEATGAGPGEPAEADVLDPLTRARGRWVDRPDAEAAEAAGADRALSGPQFVVRAVEAVIRGNLPRLFSVDDVGLWLSAMPARKTDTADADRLSRADRLELLRLLRLLLREQVPIVDRPEIFQVVSGAEPDWSALELLPLVRQRLRRRLAPPEALATPAAVVPADLEARFAAGMSAVGPGRWELPRDDIRAIADEVVAWRSRSPGPLVVVRDADLRPFFWRLLAGLVPGPAWVLTEKELP